MSLIAHFIAAASLLAGAFFMVVGCLGLIRMPNRYTRMHAASVTDTLGAGLVLFGLLLEAGLTLVAAKIVMLGLLLFFASPTATHALVRAAFIRDPEHQPREEETPSTR